MTINAPTDEDVITYIHKEAHTRRREDALQLNALFKRITGAKPIVWEDGVIGYGQYQYHYKNGDEGSHFRIGFAPRKSVHSLYIMPGYTQHQAIISKLGNIRKARACIHFSKLTDINLDVLEQLIKAGWYDMGQRYPLD